MRTIFDCFLLIKQQCITLGQEIDPNTFVNIIIDATTVV